ncbi:MAG TPA: YbjN domain-containing protein [Thermoleophilaceae bacterium]|nr:YbjN domain-containing protein [Thermoleophilaceae bacterium]
MAAVDVVDSYLEGLPGESRRLAHGEWGVSLEPEQGAGWPLHVGLRLADGVLHAQAHALDESEGLDPWMLLWWNRQTRYVRFACTRGHEIWVQGDLAAADVDQRSLDRLLGLVVEGAVAVRQFYEPRNRSRNAL